MCCQQSDARGLGHADSHTRFFVAASLALLRRHNVLHTMHLGTGDGYSGLWGVGEIPEVELLLPAFAPDPCRPLVARFAHAERPARLRIDVQAEHAERRG